MDLSDAILRGIKLARPTTRHFFDRQDGALCACALGAAYIGSGVVDTFDPKVTFISYMQLNGVTEGQLDTVVMNPVTRGHSSITGAIQNLNDDQHWSREKIAAWLKSLGM